MKTFSWSLTAFGLLISFGGCVDNDLPPSADLSTDGAMRNVMGSRVGNSVVDQRGDSGTSTPDAAAADASLQTDATKRDSALSEADASSFDGSELPEASVTIDATMPLDAAPVPSP